MSWWYCRALLQRLCTKPRCRQWAATRVLAASRHVPSRASSAAAPPLSPSLCNLRSDTIETNVWELHATHSAKAVAEQAAARASGAPSPLVDANDLVYSVVPAEQLQNGVGEGAAVYGVAWSGNGATVRAPAASAAK